MTAVERAERAALAAMRRLGRARGRYDSATNALSRQREASTMWTVMEEIKTSADRLIAADREATAERRKGGGRG